MTRDVEKDGPPRRFRLKCAASETDAVVVIRDHDRRRAEKKAHRYFRRTLHERINLSRGAWRVVYDGIQNGGTE